MKYFAVLSIIFLLAGCHKAGRKGLFAYPQLVGEFDWTYSMINSTTFYTKENSDAYGLRFEESGKVFLFKNGKLEDKGIVTRLTQFPGELMIEITLYNDDVIDMRLTDQSELYSMTYPYAAVRNSFQKK